MKGKYSINEYQYDENEQKVSKTKQCDEDLSREEHK